MSYTREDIENFIGEENQLKEAIDILVDILNGDYLINDAFKDLDESKHGVRGIK